ncbi:hypothetical protein B0G76_8412 [Paraburkholderia sp. BL23I1N1]|uniref:hypothetical protein n=1 Tax=Paraburkholderia sp. BL23I1N1 TaxID=1938802 RepID=UPI000E731F70|nr:hypothetical protein [Paraburkholderia sp. BL23I1N1]RKE23732.1 hypothetical protein B0G76_8412 [Paraburkholderia sp. BL23I1N1]
MIPNSEWVIQLVVGARADEHGSEPRYLPWAGYTQPMTGDQAMRALRACELRWPEYEFRAHPIDDGDSFSMVGAGIDGGRSTGLW